MTDQGFWFGALSTFAGATAGATVGFFGIRWQFKRESHERYEARLTDVLVRVNYEITKTLSKRQAFTRNLVTENQIIGFAFLSAASIARGRDIEMVLAMQDACLSDGYGTYEKQAKLLLTIEASVGGWRCHIKPFEFYFDQVKALITLVEPSTETAKGS